jgi:hypothetical protein
MPELLSIGGRSAKHGAWPAVFGPASVVIDLLPPRLTQMLAS